MTDQPTSDRRRFLRGAGLAGLVGLTGCLGSASGDATTSTAPAETTTGVTDSATATPAPTTTPEPTATRTPTATPTGTPTPTTQAPGPTEIAMVTDNQGSYFDPVGLLVEPGTTVTFVNESGSHSTAAYAPTNEKPRRIPADGTAWASDLFSESGATYEVTLESPGVYDFYCAPHEMLGMVGRLVVGEPRGGPGTTEPTELPPAAADSLPPVEKIVTDGTVPGP